mmetsp:Transcript_21530/g.69653  ORF Transcript_21530/g.69653 Transcript_21530/m.69653 type:complete len:213 (+) Transcript_21530:1075-1713(+)
MISKQKVVVKMCSEIDKTKSAVASSVCVTSWWDCMPMVMQFSRMHVENSISNFQGLVTKVKSELVRFMPRAEAKPSRITIAVAPMLNISFDMVAVFGSSPPPSSLSLWSSSSSSTLRCSQISIGSKLEMVTIRAGATGADASLSPMAAASLHLLLHLFPELPPRPAVDMSTLQSCSCGVEPPSSGGLVITNLLPKSWCNERLLALISSATCS